MVYKHFQNENEFLERSHDYDPNWDYEIYNDSDTEEEVKTFVAQMIAQWEASLFSKLKLFRTVKVHFGSLGTKLIAIYVNGTYTEPVIIVDIFNIKDTCKEIGDENQCLTHVAVSILHEIGHAMQEAQGKEFNEDDAELFATDYFDFGQITLP